MLCSLEMRRELQPTRSGRAPVADKEAKQDAGQRRAELEERVRRGEVDGAEVMLLKDLEGGPLAALSRHAVGAGNHLPHGLHRPRLAGLRAGARLSERASNPARLASSELSRS